MSYVDRQLGRERVVFRTRLHPVIFGNALGFAAFVIFAATMIILHNELAPSTVRLVCLGAAAVAALGFVAPAVMWRTSEFALTDRRLVIKEASSRAHTVELVNPKPDEIGVAPTFPGRLSATPRSISPRRTARRGSLRASRGRCVARRRPPLGIVAGRAGDEVRTRARRSAELAQRPRHRGGAGEPRAAAGSNRRLSTSSTMHITRQARARSPRDRS